ncbi:MAG: hypothetical protein ACK528_15090 [Alphaproteobacteria bacterium]|jgi:hypothetical protein
MIKRLKSVVSDIIFFLPAIFAWLCVFLIAFLGWYLLYRGKH